MKKDKLSIYKPYQSYNDTHVRRPLLANIKQALNLSSVLSMQNTALTKEN